MIPHENKRMFSRLSKAPLGVYSVKELLKGHILQKKLVKNIKNFDEQGKPKPTYLYSKSSVKIKGKNFAKTFFVDQQNDNSKISSQKIDNIASNLT